MRKVLLLLIGFLLIGYYQNVKAQDVVVIPADTLFLCPNNNYVDLDTIIIAEANNSGITSGETGVTYSLIMPTGVKLEPFVGSVAFSQSGNFSNTSILVTPDSVEITYDIAGGANGDADTIYVTGLRVRTSTQSLPIGDIIRGGTASHTNNEIADANTHGTISSGVLLTGVSTTPTNISCNGAGDGQITVNITAGNAPYEYSIDFGTSFPYNSSPISLLSAGGYFVTVRDSAGCLANSSSVAVITEPSALDSVSVIGTNITCNGDGDGTITASASGGTGAITFSINGGSTFPHTNGATVTALAANTYDIVFEDANGCQLDPGDIIISEPSAITEQASSESDITCNGDGDGQLTANATGGTTPIMYSIIGIGGPYSTMVGVATTSLAAATYDIYFEDANGCQLDGTDIIIAEPTTLTESSASKTDITCNGDNDGTITATAAGGTGTVNYSITGFGGPFSTQSGNTTSGLTPGAYSIVYQDANGCLTQGSNFNILEPTALAEISVTDTDIDCNGNGNGTITALASGGSTPVSFSINGGSTFPFANGATASGLSANTYDVVFEDNNGCQFDASDATISEPSAINIAAPTVSDPTSGGGTDGFIIFGAVSGGVAAYNYSIDGGSNYQTNNSFTGLSAGSYNLQVRDANNCVEVYGNITLSDPGNITGGVISFNGLLDTTLCNGSTINVVIQSDTIEPAGGGVGYQWQISTNGISWTNIGGATSPTYTINGPHTVSRYYRRETSKGSDDVYSNSVRTLINNGNAINITIPSPSVCFESPNQTVSASPAPSGSQIGVFSIEGGSGITDNGNGTAIVDPSSVGAGVFKIYYMFTNEFTCVSQDSANLTINQNTSASITPIGPNFVTTDPPQNLTGSPVGGTFTGPGVVSGQFRPNVADTGANQIIYTHFDVNGCVDYDSLNLNVTAAGSGGTISGINTRYCVDDPTDVLTGNPEAGGIPAGFQTAPFLTPVGLDQAIVDPNYTPGDYQIEFQYIVGLSTISVFATVSIKAKPTASIVASEDTLCFNDPMATLTGSPVSGTPNEQDFYGAAISSTGQSATFDPAAAGVGTTSVLYVLENSDGCNDTASIDLLVNPNPSVSISGLPVSYCSNDPIDTLIGSPTPNDINTFGSFSGAGLSNDTMGTVNFSPGIAVLGNQSFTYTYTNEFGCEDAVTEIRNVALIPTATLTGLDANYCTNGQNDTLTGGTNPVVAGSGTFIGLGGANGSIDGITGIVDVTALPTGASYQYGYVFTSGNGCIDTAFQSTTINELPTVSLSIDTSFCIDDADYTFTGIPSKTGADIIAYSGPGITTSGDNGVFDPLAAGIGVHELKYIYTDVYSANNCTDSASQLVSVNSLPTVDFFFTDAFTGDTVTDLRFCRNEDSIVLKSNHVTDNYFYVGSTGVFVQRDTLGQGYLNPSASTYPPINRSITYQFTSDTTGCFNQITKNFQINRLPTAYNFTGPANNERFCYDDDSVLLAGATTPQNILGFGTFRLEPDTSSNPGGIASFGAIDSAYFKPQLNPGETYTIWYRFTDTTTSCQDSLSRDIIINDLPIPQIEIIASGFPSASLDTANHGPYDVCINGGNLQFEGLDDGSPLTYSNVSFTDLLDPSSIESQQVGLDSNYVFVPANTNILGTRDILFEMTSSLGCTDSFTFQINVLDTPALDLIFDPTFLSSTGQIPEVCENVDTVMISTSSSMTGFGDISVPLSNPNLPSFIYTDTTGGLSDTALFVNPNLVTGNLNISGNSFAIMYSFTEDVSGRSCSNTIQRFIKVNPLPENFTFVSSPARIEDDPPMVNEFCTEDDTVTLIGQFSNPGNPGSGFFRLSPPNTTTTSGGVFNAGPDTATFISSLLGGSSWDIRYIFTDSVTGCSDSIAREVYIRPDPILSVKSIIDGSEFINTISPNPNRNVCINGSDVALIGFNFDSITSSFDSTFSATSFQDLTDPGTIQIDTAGADNWEFSPANTDILGLHTLQFEYTSGIGCSDLLTFNLFLLDTPSLDILVDTTFSTNFNNSLSYCKSLDTLDIIAESSIYGYADFNISPNISNEAVTNIDTVLGNINDSIFRIYPDQFNQVIPNNGTNFTISLAYTETTTDRQCSNSTTKDFTIYPLPNVSGNGFDIQNTYCEYDTLDLINGSNTATFIPDLDTAFFKGPSGSISNFANDSATFDPGTISPAFTNSGTTIDVWYIASTNKFCSDSTMRPVTIHPKPNIEFTIGDPVVTQNQFCNSSNVQEVIFESLDTTSDGQNFNGAPSREIVGSTLITPLTSGSFFRPSVLDSGLNVVYVKWTTTAGCVDIDSQDIYIYNDPSADFSVSGFCLLEGEPIDFTDLSDNNDITGPFGNLPDSIVSWEWQFAPAVNAVSNLQNPSYDYLANGFGQGTRTVELTVTNTVGCSDDTDKLIYFGEPPIAKFSFSDFCVGDSIIFTNSSENVDSVSPGDNQWTLTPFNQPNNIIETFVEEFSFPYVFASAGAYDMNLDLSTSYGCNDDTTIRIDIRPVINVGSGITYTSDFANDSIEWRPGTFDSAYTWQQTIPSGSIINSGPENANEVVWVTNASGPHIPGEKSYIEGPCFNFLGSKRPMISFDYFSDLPTTSGAVIQYSFDRGNTWTNLGTLESGIEWFNASSIAGNPGNQTLGQIGWSQVNSGWREAKHNMDALRNRTNVRLRIAMGTFGNQREGIAVTNFEIREKDKMTLIEHFTNSSDLNAKQGDIDHNDVVFENRYDVLDVQFHTDFPNDDPINLDNSLENNARSLFYGVSSVPRTVFEGNQFNNATSAWIAQSNQVSFQGNTRHKEIAYRSLEDAKFSIDLDVQKTTSSLSGKALITALPGVEAGREYTAFIAVIEKNIPWNVPGGGIVLQDVEFKNVFKKFLPQASGTNITSLNNAGNTRTINFSWNYDNVYFPDSVFIVAYLQDNVTREIYQAATDDTTNVFVPNGTQDQLVSGKNFEFKLYPNPSLGRSIVDFSHISDGQEILRIYDQLGNIIVEESINLGTKNVLIDLHDHPSGLYILQFSHPKFGTRTKRLVLSK